MFQGNSKKQKQFVPADNPVEIIKDLGNYVANEVKAVPQQIFDTAIEQLTSKPQRKPLAGEIDLNAGIHKKTEVSAGHQINQLRNVQQQEKMVFDRRKQEMDTRINQIVSELKLEVGKLQQQTAELSSDIKKITVENMPANMGVYHLNFFDFIIAAIRDLRKKIGQSKLWLNASSNKKKQKGFWAMAKKHGNTFLMSDERGIATAGG